MDMCTFLCIFCHKCFDFLQCTESCLTAGHGCTSSCITEGSRPTLALETCHFLIIQPISNIFPSKAFSRLSYPFLACLRRFHYIVVHPDPPDRTASSGRGSSLWYVPFRYLKSCYNMHNENSLMYCVAVLP